MEPLALGKSIFAAGAAAGPVLGIDTGGPVASLGVVANGQIKAVLSRSTISHCAGLPDAVGEILDSTGLTIRALAAVAVAIGPGSFTGLRVGLSYAKGLVLGCGLAIVGVPTLDAMALCALNAERGPGGLVCPILDARRGEVYTGLYRFAADTLEKVTGDLIVPLADFVASITDAVVFVGESKAEEARALVCAAGGNAAAVGAAQLHLRGSFVAAIGAARVTRNEADDAASLEPVYVRPPDMAATFAAVKSGENRLWNAARKN